MLERIRSQRIAHLVQSEIRAMTRACTAVGGVNMGQGICDVPAPDLVKDAAHAAIDADTSIYTRYDGLAELRGALSERLLRDNGVAYDAETEIVATIGASGALTSTMIALCDPGDEILLFEPFYGYHLNTAVVSGLVPRFVRLEPPHFAIDLDRVRDAITPKTRAIVVNTPNNPSGKVFTREELEGIGSICREFGIICITDEVYEYLVYTGAEHLSMASIPGMRDLTVTVSSYSKTFSITGWRIGFAAAPAELAGPIGLVNDLYYICAPAPLQSAVAHGIRTFGPEYYRNLRDGYEAKRDVFCGVLAEAGLNPIVPAGAYYVLADVSSLGCATAKEAAMKLLNDAGVASVAGSAFYGEGGEHLVRFCYAKQQADLDRACEQLATWGRRR